MLALAGYVAFVLHLEGFDRAADIYLGHGLDRVAHSNVAHFGFGLTRSARRFAGKGRQAGNVDLISDEVGEIQRPVSRMAKMKCDRLPASDTLGQCDPEKSYGVRLGHPHDRTVFSEYLSVRDGQLLVWVRVLGNDRP